MVDCKPYGLAGAGGKKRLAPLRRQHILDIVFWRNYDIYCFSANA